MGQFQCQMAILMMMPVYISVEVVKKCLNVLDPLFWKRVLCVVQ